MTDRQTRDKASRCEWCAVPLDTSGHSLTPRTLRERAERQGGLRAGAAVESTPSNFPLAVAMSDLKRTVPVRVSDDLAAPLQRVAATNGTTPGREMEKAWRWWWRKNGKEIVDDLHVRIEAMRPKRGFDE